MVEPNFIRPWGPLAAMFLLACSAAAQQPPPPMPLPPAENNASLVYKVDGAGQRLEMTVHTSRILTLDQKIPQAQVNNPDVLTLTPLSPNQVQISAKTTGVTQVNLWGEDRKLHTIDVIVYGDAQELAMILRSTFPSTVLKVIPVSNAVLISGFVDKPEHIARIVQIAEEYYPKVINNMTVGGVQQVLLHIKVMEVSRTKLRQLGFDWAKISGANMVSSGVSGLVLPPPSPALPAGAIGSFTPPAPSTLANNPINGTLSFNIAQGTSAFFGVLNALRQDNLLKISSEPTLVVISGHKAVFLSGGQIPVPAPQSLGTISIDWKDYGTMIEFLPIVLGNGKIRMDVHPEISELDEAHSITIAGTTEPGILTRNAQTTVEMQAGQTLAIAGLVEHTTEGVTSGLPWISDVPYVGALFRNIHDQENDIELLILVTPELADPLNASEVPPCGPGSMTTDPSDWEMFMKGYLEVPKCCPAQSPGSRPGLPSGPRAAPPLPGMLPPPETVPSPPPAGATNGSPTSAAVSASLNPAAAAAGPYHRYAPPKPDDAPAAPSPPGQNNPPGLIGPSGYDVVK